MLVRILTDNPGQTFTRNLDDKFVETTRTLLKNGKDAGVRQLLMETLEYFARTKMHDDGLRMLILMWGKEKDKVFKDFGGRMPPVGPRPPYASPAAPASVHSQNYFAKSHSSHRLPNAAELASRLEEARTSAKLLEQVVMNTPPGEMLHNDLIREFANRCLSASRSIQGYMVSENPAPDNDTMEKLIDTNEQLQTALSQHQCAMLSARKQLGLGATTDDVPSPLQEPDPAWGRRNQAASSSSYGAGAEVYVSGGNGKGKQAEAVNYGLPSRPAGNGSGSGQGRTPGDEPREANLPEGSFPEKRVGPAGQGSSKHHDSKTTPVGKKGTMSSPSMPVFAAAAAAAAAVATASSSADWRR